jgi:A/G-specific adenine glycosylase
VSRGRRAASAPPVADGEGDAGIALAVERWFTGAARALPWRTSPRDPYHALVAEAMLQQTQVSRVIDKYRAFIEAFPTVQSLAAADEERVLALWTGLGYYRRAKNLHAAAKAIVERFGGLVPRDVESLRTLKGVGPYTAGAIRSIAFNEPAPIVDGNVARVLLRVHGRDAASDDKAAQPWLWERAGALVLASSSPAAFNEGLMELGATVCLPPPASPACLLCPLKGVCAAHRAGREMEIPRPKTRAERQAVWCAVAVVRNASGGVLLERRPAGGMWAGLWQAPTLESSRAMPTRTELARAVGITARSLCLRERFEFLATHRRMTFDVYDAALPAGLVLTRGELVGPLEAAERSISSPQRRALRLTD